MAPRLPLFSLNSVSYSRSLEADSLFVAPNLVMITRFAISIGFASALPQGVIGDGTSMTKNEIFEEVEITKTSPA
ncbi:unannotated protein [freshwater metagenome]|uniref:Unannotated protein n=1 Tax=freshwater metagenome TaxID=449393 RepID=A0A6J6GEP8_9ZZZZ